MRVSQAPNLQLIVAVSENMGIGREGQLPWRLKSELKYFARVTKATSDDSKKNAVLMGRKTWESIPEKFRPLAGRVNIVLTSQKARFSESLAGDSSVHVCSSFSEAVNLLQESLAEKVEKCWVIGGSSVYAEAMKHSGLKRLYVTRVLKEFECDTFLPLIEESEWKIVSDESIPKEIQEEDDIKFKYEVYERASS